MNVGNGATAINVAAIHLDHTSVHVWMVTNVKTTHVLPIELGQR
jgi:hypothetical protein